MNDDHFILFTTMQGGYMKAIRGTREQYDKAVEIGTLRIPTAIDEQSVDEVRFYLIAFGTIEANYDRGLQGTRG